MPKKHTTVRISSRAQPSEKLENRVSALERKSRALSADLMDAREELAAMRASLNQFDTRQMRVEKMIVAVQLDQHRMMRTLETISTAVTGNTPQPSPVPEERQLESGGSEEEDVDEDVEDTDADEDAPKSEV